jgi:hypothetical protein
MRAFVQRSVAFVLLSSAPMVSGRALAQADSAPSGDATTAAEQPEEVTVRGQRTMVQYRLELQRARDDIIRIFNAANEGNDTDIRCRDERPTGTRVRHSVCRSAAENRASAEAGRRFLNSLFLSTQGSFAKLGFGGDAWTPPNYSNFGTANTEQAGKVGEGDALAAFEEEFKRLISENRDLYRAVTTYVEIEQEYIRARGDTPAPGTELLAAPVVLEQAPTQAAGPVCEATSLTEYEQRNDVARVSGTVSISSCPAGTTGSFTIVARVRDDTGEIRPIEFVESWQRTDTQDHRFEAEYPLGDDVFLQSVRVRNLMCTCAPAQ